MPRKGEALGILGSNGIGKSSILKILSGNIQPNLGRFMNPPDWKEIILHFRGSGLQNFFTRIVEKELKSKIKPQYVDYIPRAVHGIVSDILRSKDQKGILDEMVRLLDIDNILDKDISVLSGGELQRFAICIVSI